MGSSSSPAAIRPASSASTLAADAAALPSALTPVPCDGLGVDDRVGAGRLHAEFEGQLHVARPERVDERVHLASRLPDPVRHPVAVSHRLPPSGHLDRPGDPRRHRCRRRNLRMDNSGRTSARRSTAGGDRASPQRRQRPHQLGDQGARNGSPASRRGLLSRLSGGRPHRRTWPHRRRDHRRIRATRQPQTRAARSRRQACTTTRRPRPATPRFRHTT